MIEVVLPVRNPTAVFHASVDSLIAQTHRDFSVLISDNFSTSGQEILDAAEARLTEAGISVRRIRPPVEIGRVDHWNWSHHQVTAPWIKPLFTGDWLSPEYMALTLAAIAAHPQVDIVNCSMARHYPNGRVDETHYADGFRSPEQVVADAFRESNCFGGPVNTCYRQLAFVCAGGYPPSLPVSADFWLIIALALRHGLVTCGPVLAHFNFHPTRFTTNFPYHRIDGHREEVIILLAASSQAAFNEIPADFSARNRYYWSLFKRGTKARLKKLVGSS